MLNAANERGEPLCGAIRFTDITSVVGEAQLGVGRSRRDLDVMAIDRASVRALKRKTEIAMMLAQPRCAI